MTVLIAPDGREYRTSDTVEIKRLTTGFRYKVKPDESGEVFDPRQHTVKEVQAYLGANPDDEARVFELERQGESRKTIVGED